MKKSTLLILSLFFVFAISCKEDKKTVPTAELTQMERVMDMHDEVMPKMSKISTLASKLRKKIDSDNGSMIEKEAMDELQAANKSMMDWMQDFMGHFDHDEINKGKTLTPEKQALLDADEQKMIEVKNKMEASIKNAEALLGQK